MTVYSMNLGIGWASSGVEYAQAYRAKIFKKLGIDSKFVFTDLIVRDNLADLTRNIGFEDDQVMWLYHHFTDLHVGSVTFTLDRLKAEYQGNLTREEREGKRVRLFDEANDIFLSAYLVNEKSDLVHRVEFVSKGKLIRKDFYSYTKVFTEYYAPHDKKAKVYQRRFFNEDGSVAYEEIVDDKDSIFRFPNKICYSKEEFIAYFMEDLNLQADDLVLLDRSTGIGQAVFRTHKPAKLAVAIHADHYSENATRENTILWNNYYEYQFDNADKVDFFIVATEAQRELLLSQFEKYTDKRPTVVVIPVGSIDHLRYPINPRRHNSMMTASRLASEKHVDWLVKAVIEAKKVLPDLTFDIYGSGSEHAKLEKIIKDAGVEKDIRLMGHRDLTTVYQDYELYLSASKSEGFGLTLLEAVGSGLPLIGFDVRYGNQTFIQDGQNGYRIPRPFVDNEQEIVQHFSDHIISYFVSVNREAWQTNSYTLANGFLTTKIEEKWANLVKETIGHD